MLSAGSVGTVPLVPPESPACRELAQPATPSELVWPSDLEQLGYLGLDLDDVVAALELPDDDLAGLQPRRAVLVPRLTFKRALRGPEHDDGPSIGDDVLAWKRMLWRWDVGVFPGPAVQFDRVYNRRVWNATRVAQRAWNLPATGHVDRRTFERSLRALRARGARDPDESAWDALAVDLYRQARVEKPPARCFLLPEGADARNLGGVAAHMARRLGNWQSDHAVDIGTRPGTPVLAPLPGYVSRVSGRDPRLGPRWPLFGHSITVEHPDHGDASFVTHVLELVDIGERVVAGEVIAVVGDWPGSTTMDHVHFGRRRGNPEDVLAWPRVRPYARD